MENNRLCRLLGIRYPIIQAPMNWITGADLAAAVSNAGGLGTLGPNAGATTLTTDVAETGERLRRQIRKVKSLTDKPFAVNFPVGMEGIQGEGGRKFAERCVAVALEEGISVAITSVGPPNVFTKAFHDAGVKVLHAVSTPTQAEKAEETGVDAVICEGFEGGGHKAPTELTTFAMIPMTADRVKIPIIAAGGIADARGLVAALALGADGVYVGTRFIATRECDAHPRVKEAILGCGDTGTMTINKWMVVERALRNRFAQEFAERQARGESAEKLYRFLTEHSMHRGLVQGDSEEGDVPCGQIAGAVRRIVSAAEVIEEMVKGIRGVLDRLEAGLPA